MKNEILDILTKANFSKDFIHYTTNNFPMNYSLKIEDLFQSSSSVDAMLQLDKESQLFELLAQLIKLKNDYLSKNIPLIHFYNSIYDLNYRVMRYYHKEHIFGVGKKDLKWLAFIYRGEIFDLGSLRFQMTSFNYQEIEREGYQYMPLDKKWKKRFPETEPIINIHIIKNADLSPDKVEDSLTAAIHFFANYFPAHDYEIFLCRTWLLYPPMRQLLDPDSNIVSFSKRFEIIAKNENAKQALDRIYGTSDLETICSMDKESSLEQSAYKNLDNLGVAAGIIYK